MLALERNFIFFSEFAASVEKKNEAGCRMQEALVREQAKFDGSCRHKSSVKVDERT